MQEEKKIYLVHLYVLLRDLSDISRGEGVESGGGSYFFQLSNRAGSEKNWPDLSIYLIQI